MLQSIFTVIFLFEKHAYLLCNSKEMNIWSTVIYKYRGLYSQSDQTMRFNEVTSFSFSLLLTMWARDQICYKYDENSFLFERAHIQIMFKIHI